MPSHAPSPAVQAQEGSTTSAGSPNGTAPNIHNLTNGRDTNAQDSLQQPLTRRHSLPASYHLSNFLSFFNHNDAGGSEVSATNAQAKASPGPPQDAAHNTPPTQATAPTAAPAPTSPPVNSGSVNRHRYGHRHTRSAVLDQPVVVRTYNPPATPRASARAGMMNPAIYEEEEAQRVELPPIEAFSLDGILKAINPEVTKTLEKVTHLCVRLREDVKAEVETTAQNQREIHAQKQQAEKLAAHVLKTTTARCDTLTADCSGLKGGAAVEDLAQLTERTYTTLGSIISTLLAIDELLPPQERLAPEYSAHQTHYPRLHGLLNKKYQEINARFGASAVASGRLTGGGRAIPRITRQSAPATAALSPPGSPTNLSASLPNPTHQEPGWLRRRMSSSSTMLLSPKSSSSDREAANAAKRLSLPPHLQLRTILPSPSYGQSPPRNNQIQTTNPKRSIFPGLPQSSSNLSRRQSTNALSSRAGSERRNQPYSASIGPGTGDHSSTWSRQASSDSGRGFFGSGSWKGTGKWGFFGGRASSTESEKGLSAEEKLRRVLNGSKLKGKTVDRR
ncbi:hypothetical protein DFH27DRAFT_611662 [Peziza echinospora]|nr:hypothetical protein DFH27DRAFT_611662 [Peziza echinospora]